MEPRCSASELLEINEHRLALGYEPFPYLTQEDYVLHTALIDARAPYGNDPWDNNSIDESPPLFI